MKIQVKSVNLPKEETQNNFKAYAEVVINDVLSIKNIQVREGQYGLFTDMPGRVKEDEQGNKTFTPIVDLGKEDKMELKKAVLNAYDKVSKGEQLPEVKVDLENGQKESKDNIKVFMNVSKTDDFRKAFGSIQMGDTRINNVMLQESKEGNLYVKYPQLPDKEGNYQDVVIPQSKEISANITEKAKSSYDLALKKENKQEKAKEEESEEMEE